MNHLGFTAPVLTNAACCEAGIGNQMVHPLGAELIPQPQPMQLPADHRTQARSHQRRAREIRVHLIPGVAHGGVDITDMQLIRAGEHPLGHQMTAADHQLSGPKINLLNRHGQQRQVLLNVRDPKRQALNRAGENRASRHPTGRTPTFTVHQGGQLGTSPNLRQPLINGLHHQFGSTG